MKTLALAVLLGGCLLGGCFWNADPHPIGDDDAPPPDELGGYPCTGKGDQVGFGLELGRCERVIAERATAWVFAHARKTGPRPASVTSDNPGILEVVDSELYDDSPELITFDVRSVTSGDADVVVRDSGGIEIDRVTLHARPTDQIEITSIWGAGPVHILAGAVERIHVRTRTQGVITAGSGAVEVSVSGDLTIATREDAPLFYSEGDQGFFTAGASGTGTVTASAPNTSLAIDVAITQPSELTSITRSVDALEVDGSDPGRISIGAMAGAAPVFGAQCTWSTVPAGLHIELADHPSYGEQSGFLDSSTAALIYTVSNQPGTWSATCTMPNGLSTTIPVRITP